MPSLFPLYFSVCMPVSASLYHYRLSLHPFRNLCECISFCSVSFHFSFNFIHFLNVFPVSWILFQLSLLFQSGGRLGELLIQCFISDKQCDHSQSTNLLHFKFLPFKRGYESPFYLLTWASMRRIQWDGNSNASVIVETSYLSGTLYPSLYPSLPYPQDMLFRGFESLHSTILLKGRLRPHIVIWLIQHYRTESLFKPMSFP